MSNLSSSRLCIVPAFGAHADHPQIALMAETFIPTSLQKLWSVWNIRGFVILSLFLQVLLASIAHLRKKSTNRFIVFVIWSAYFVADWAATFTFGLISNARRNDSITPSNVNENLLAFWAAFLLIHLGGPDMITAFSLEDNALWMRHLVGLVAQLFTFFYIFLKTLPDNNLAVPTVLIAVAGAIKYGERTRALYLASMENLKKSIVKLPTTSISDLGSSDDEDRMSKEAFHFVQIFKGLVVDIRPNLAEQSQSREFFLEKEARNAFDLMIMELDLLYEIFYTKILAVNSSWGLLARTFTYYNVIVALVLYCLSKKEGFHEVDIWITYFLLAGVVALDTLTGMMFIVSNWKDQARWFHLMCVLAQGLCFIIPSIVLVVLLFLSLLCGYGQLVFKSWCEKLGAFSLLSHCIGQCRRRDSIPKKYARMLFGFVTGETKGHISWNAFNQKIRNFIFEELKERALLAEDADKVKEIYEARGSWTLMKVGNADELVRYVNKFDYDRSLLAWHIATEICHNMDRAVDVTDSEQRKLAVILSDYMHYLLTKKPEMMSAVAGISHIRYRDTCAEIKHFCGVLKAETTYEFCTRILDEVTSIEPANEYKDKGTSVLSDACDLARVLRQKDKKWEIISRVWVEFLMYAAGHCRPEKHARALSEGGELVTIIWLLMAHFGIGPHFPYPED